jgi:hypothetical protein
MVLGIYLLMYNLPEVWYALAGVGVLQPKPSSIAVTDAK